MKRSLLPFAFLIAIAGCGGGGGSAGGGGTPVPVTPPSESGFATALVRVDVPSGEVQVIPQNGDSRAVFSGSAIQITTSRLLEDTADVTRRVIRTTFRNTLAEDIGADEGLEVSLRGLQPMLTPPTDRRSSTLVRTISGSGVSGAQDGPPLSASLGAATAVWYDYSTDTFFWIQGTLLRMLTRDRVTTLSSSVSGQAMTGNDQDDLFIADQHQIRRYSKRTGAFQNVVVGSTNPGFAEGQGADAQFDTIRGLTMGPGGYLFVADSNNNRIRRVQSPAGEMGGYADQGYSVPNPQSLTFAYIGTEFGGTTLLANTIVGQGRIYVTQDEGKTGFFIGSEALGNLGGGSPAFRPTSITSFGSTLIVGDGGNRTVKTVNLLDPRLSAHTAGWWTSWLAGTSGAFADGPGNTATFGTSLHLDATSRGELLVYDSANNRIRRIESATGENLLTVGPGGPSSGLVAIGNASGIRTTPAGGKDYIYHLDGLRSNSQTQTIDMVFSLSGGVTSFQFLVTVSGKGHSGGPLPASAGNGSSGTMVRTLVGRPNSLLMLDGPVSSASIKNVLGVQTINWGEVFFLDEGPGSDAVRIYDNKGQVRSMFGARDVNNPSANLASEFGTPSMRAFCVSPQGTKIFIATDSGLYLARFNPPTDFDTGPSSPGYYNLNNWQVALILGSHATAGTVDGAGLNARIDSPTALEFDITGRQGYLAQGNVIRRVVYTGGEELMPSAWKVSFAAGDAAAGASDGVGSAARFNGIRGMSLDSHGSLWVSDSGSHTIRRMDSSGSVATIAGTAGSSGYSDATGAAARFSEPAAIDTDGFGYAYVLSQNRIRRISPTGEVRTCVRSGAVADGMGNTAGIQAASGLAVNRFGDAYFGDRGTLRTAQRVVNTN